MKGKVHSINSKRGMVAVKTDEGYSVLELLGNDDIESGDEMFWKKETPLGSEVVTNITKNQKFEVYFQNHHVSEANLEQQLLK